MTTWTDDENGGTVWSEDEAAGTALGASTGSSLVGFIQSGSGAIPSDVQTALRLSVHTSQYSTQGNYETARDALTGTTGVNNLDVSGDLSVTGTITGC